MASQLDVDFGRLAVARGMVPIDDVRAAYRAIGPGRSLKDELVAAGKLSFAQAEALEAELRTRAARRGTTDRLEEARQDGSDVFEKPPSDEGLALPASSPAAAPAPPGPRSAPRQPEEGAWDLVARSGSGHFRTSPVRDPPPSEPRPAPGPREPARSSGTGPVAPAAAQGSGSWDLRAGSAPALRKSGGQPALVPAPVAPAGPPPPVAAPPTPDSPPPADDRTVVATPPADPPSSAFGRQTAADSPLPRPGELIDGRYRLIKQLGQGGMGAVYEAQDQQLKTAVAIKVILPKADPDGTLLRRFEREAQSLARVTHPGVVRIREAGLFRGMPYAVMDLVRGRDLKAIVREEGPLAPGLAIAHAAAIARAVNACHAVGVLHRDLKPANVLVRAEDGAPLVTDFGLALVDDDSERLTKTGEMLGTPAYMSPEQAEGQRELIDERTDVYALGATLYELLTARPPFEGSPIHILKQVFTDMPRPPSQLVAELPAGIDAICLKALAKEPAQRYASARELAEDLERVLRREPIKARAPTRWEVLRWRVRRRDPRALALVALPVLLLLLPGIQLGRWFLRQREQEWRWKAWVQRIECHREQATASIESDDLIPFTERYLREGLGKRLSEAVLRRPVLQVEPEEPPGEDDAACLRRGLAQVGLGLVEAPRDALGAAEIAEGLEALGAKLLAGSFPGRPPELEKPQAVAARVQRLELRYRAVDLPRAGTDAWPGTERLLLIPERDPELDLLRALVELGWNRRKDDPPRKVDLPPLRGRLDELMRGSAVPAIQSAASAALEELAHLEKWLADWRRAGLAAVAEGRSSASFPETPSPELAWLLEQRFGEERPRLASELLLAITAWAGKPENMTLEGATAVGDMGRHLVPVFLRQRGSGGALLLAALAELPPGDRRRAEEAKVELFRRVCAPIADAARRANDEEETEAQLIVTDFLEALSALASRGDPATEFVLDALTAQLVDVLESGKRVPIDVVLIYMRYGGAGLFSQVGCRIIARSTEELDQRLRTKPSGDAHLARAVLDRENLSSQPTEGQARALNARIVKHLALALGPSLSAEARKGLGLDPWPPADHPLPDPPLSEWCVENARWRLGRMLLLGPDQGGSTDPGVRLAALALLLEVSKRVERLYPVGDQYLFLKQTVGNLQGELAERRAPEALRKELEPLCRRWLELAWRDLEEAIQRQAEMRDASVQALMATGGEAGHHEHVRRERLIPALRELELLLDRRAARELVARTVDRLDGLELGKDHALRLHLAELDKALGDTAAAAKTGLAVVEALSPIVRSGGGSPVHRREMRELLDQATRFVAQLRLDEGDAEAAREMLKLALEDGVLDDKWDPLLPRLDCDRASLGDPARRVPKE